MEFNEYQKFTKTTAIYPPEKAIDYLILGLTSEAGEVASLRKKNLRGDAALDTKKLMYELGDCLWYVARIADEIGIDLEYLATKNRDKLQNRKENNKIKGEGDDR